MVKKTELAWAAGLYDGEGCTSAVAQGGAGQHKALKTRMMVTISQKDRGVLDRFQAAVGCGKVYGPYPSQKGVPYRYSASNTHAEKVLKLIWPYLGEIKRAQADRARNSVRAELERKGTILSRDAGT